MEVRGPDGLDLVRLAAGWKPPFTDWPPSSATPGIREMPAERDERFHTLPGSKQYADNDDETREILRRHQVLLHETVLALTDTPVVVTASWSESPKVTDREAELAAATPDAVHWHSYFTDYIWWHLFAHLSTLQDLGPLLRLVADGTGPVTITDLDWTWRYHPYDGGCDVVAPSTAERDALAEMHRDWLAPDFTGRIPRTTGDHEVGTR